MKQVEETAALNESEKFKQKYSKKKNQLMTRKTWNAKEWNANVRGTIEHVNGLLDNIETIK